MKTLLLASASIVAFAGAAAADVDFSGSAKLGYNDTDATATDDNEYGFYGEINLDVALSAELDNGLTVSASADVDELDAGDADFGGVTLTLASETASLVYGDTEFAAVDAWAGVGSMDDDGFAEQDGETVLKATVAFGGVDAAVSYIVQNGDGTGLDEVEGLSIGATTTLGSVDLSVAYQEEAAGVLVDGADDNEDPDNQAEIFGISAATTFAGADVAFGYAMNNTADDSSIGVEVAYPFGPVTATASYVMEDAGEDNWDIKVAYAEGALALTVYTDESEDYGLEASYDLGNGIALEGGLVDGGDTTYVAGTYDLGNGAALLVSYVDTDAVNNDDEYGPSDLQEGATVELSFGF